MYSIYTKQHPFRETMRHLSYKEMCEVQKHMDDMYKGIYRPIKLRDIPCFVDHKEVVVKQGGAYMDVIVIHATSEEWAKELELLKYEKNNKVRVYLENLITKKKNEILRLESKLSELPPK